MRYTSIEFSGITLDTFLGESGTAYVTLTSIASGLGISRQTVKNWNKAHNPVEGKPVQVGKFKSAATAYPIDVIGDFLDHRVKQGDKQALALYSATFRADLDRSIKEANGIQVTAAQHEEVRHNTRLALLQQWVKDNYHPVVNKDGLVVPFEGSVAREAGITDAYEATIVDMEAHVARREVQIARGTWSEAQVAEERSGIEKYKQNILTLAQKLTN